MFRVKCQKNLRWGLAAVGLLAIFLQFVYSGAGNAQAPAEAAPGDAGSQYGLLKSYCEKTRELAAQGKNAEALDNARECLARASRLAGAEPGNAKLQQALAAANAQAGFVLEAQGKLAEALTAFQDAQAIMKHLAGDAPTNVDWQDRLAWFGEEAGRVLLQQGKQAEGLKAFQDSIAIWERLTAADPNNKKWRPSLAMTGYRAGDVLAKQGKRAEALALLQNSLAVWQSLASADPGKALWQTSLAMSYAKIGEVLEKEGNLEGAVQAYRDGHAVFKRLAEIEPGNTDSRYGVAAIHAALARAYCESHAFDKARAELRQGLAVMEGLTKLAPDQAQWAKLLGWFKAQIGLLGGDIVDSQIDEAVRVLESGTATEKAQEAGRIEAHPENFAPPVLFALSQMLFGSDKKDEAMFWFYAAQLRTRFDANRCADKYLGSQAAESLTGLDGKYGRPINKYAFQNLPKLEEVVPRVVEWDRKTPRNYDERWIGRFGLEAFLSTPGVHHFIGTPSKGSVPKEQWEGIAEKTREEYLEGFKEMIRVARGGVPRWKGRFVVDNRGVWFDSTRVKDADVASFEYIAGIYAKDKNHVFCAGKTVQGADVATFSPVDVAVGKDAKAVYWCAARCEECDPATFRKIEGSWYRDAKFIYWEGERCKDCDVETFHKAAGGWYMDRNAAYFGNIRTAGVDERSFEVMDGGYAKDKRTVFFKGRPLAGVDPESFELVRGEQETPREDRSFFAELFDDLRFAKDKQTVFFQGRPVAGADAKSFKSDCGKCQVCGQDKNRCYKRAQPVPCGCTAYPLRHSLFPIEEIPPGKAKLEAKRPVFFQTSDAGGKYERIVAPGRQELAFVCRSGESGESPPVELTADIEPGQFYRFVRGESENCSVKIERPIIVRGRQDGPEIRIQPLDWKKWQYFKQGRWVREVELPAGQQELTVLCREVTREKEMELPVTLSLDLQPGVIYQLEGDYRVPQNECSAKAVPLALLSAKTAE